MTEERNGAWSSGRLLSTAQRQRKREKDRTRISQRRKQTASHVEALEAKVTSLEAAVSVEQICYPMDCWQRRIDPESTDTAFITGAESTECFAEEEGILDRTEHSNCQKIFNEMIEAASRLSPSQVCTDKSLNQDALIRGVLYGWHSTIAKYPFICPLWKVIKHLDTRLFRLSGTLTRFCTLRMIHHMLLYIVNATEVSDLPSWYRPRPTQRAISHPLAIDVLPWPGLRERAVLDPDLTSSNVFWNDVIYCFRFCWPYDEADAIKINPVLKSFEFTGKFQNYVTDIRMWTMDEKFFHAFPDTFDDIIPAPRLEWPLVIDSHHFGVLAPADLPLPLVEEEHLASSMEEQYILATT